MVAEDRESPNSRLARLIKELRGSTSQREFAKLLGTSYTTVQDWEKQIRLPSQKNLRRLSQLKGWTQAELMNHLFSPKEQGEHQEVDPVKRIVTQLPKLSPEQIRALSDYLGLRMKSQKVFQNDRQG